MGKAPEKRRARKWANGKRFPSDSIPRWDRYNGENGGAFHARIQATGRRKQRGRESVSLQVRGSRLILDSEPARRCGPVIEERSSSKLFSS